MTGKKYKKQTVNSTPPNQGLKSMFKVAPLDRHIAIIPIIML